ncbi:helix-turn-helix domain-containing protein [Lactococcus lactis subsp. lactis]|uniref:Helix-turn-helix domain-containing protein n=2 Tax=Lactococcus lactis TaxID=1358 RepID=A0A9X4NDM4_9LACT|nr:XRE family transcriptional regulator [Lactococcus lactis]KST80976.1 Phage repressor [Lactococcus lactis subsp. lactis]MDT3324848.1 helix-turn-helix domain-containing protein [Bacillota bacterium]KGF76761.1 HTH-type transcriptional regulator [Lactococcus lactis]MBR8680511.1 helix-turn-helix domain-containing protein [Lactococcus lactis subsp. lactis]MBR8682836.1 helix-turn-helix domain-containing protein [Lactococcus lactis subsp. lactis]
MENLLKNKRLEKKMTLEQVGELVGVGKSTVRKWENGMIENMGRDKIVALSKALNISPLDILGLTDDESVEPIIEKTIQKMKQLEESRQKIVLDTANSQLKEQEKETAKVISLENKKIQQTIDLAELVDDSKIDWDKWVSFEGKPLTDEAKEEMKRVLGKRLENKDK